MINDQLNRTAKYNKFTFQNKNRKCVKSVVKALSLLENEKLSFAVYRTFKKLFPFLHFLLSSFYFQEIKNFSSRTPLERAKNKSKEKSFALCEFKAVLDSK